MKFYINECIAKIENNGNLKEIYIKNRPWYYFDDIIKIEYFGLESILIDERSYANILL